MLDTDTKRRIDTARDILVGKVPDPKSQVEQITIALIYKFMDDMDAESEEFGGKRKFFANEFARYGWAKLMRSGMGGHEIMQAQGKASQSEDEHGNIRQTHQHVTFLFSRRSQRTARRYTPRQILVRQFCGFPCPGAVVRKDW